MTVAAVQARLEMIEAKFQPADVSLTPPGASSEFAELLQIAGAGSTTSGTAHRLGSASLQATGGLNAGTNYSMASSSSTTALSMLSQALGGSTGGSASGQAAVSQGMKHLGTPYLWGGTDPNVGLDCSALVQHAYRDIGVNLPRVSRDQARMGIEIPDLDSAQPGDLIAFGSPVDHISMYVGNGKILQAPRTGDVVKVSDISRPIATIRRIVSPQTSAAGFGSYGSAGVSSGSVGGASELQYQALFQEAGQRHGVDPALLAAVASVESGFNPTAQSPVGAQGLMQFMPATANEMGVDPMDPASAIDGAARYLKREINRFGSIELAAAAYNAGAGAVSRHGGIPPYAETQNYVKKVISAYEARR